MSIYSLLISKSNSFDVYVGQALRLGLAVGFDETRVIITGEKFAVLAVRNRLAEDKTPFEIFIAHAA